MVGEGEGGQRVGTNGEGELEWEAELLSARVCQDSGKVSAQLVCARAQERFLLCSVF